MSDQPYWLTEANTKLLVQHPFFASLLMDMITIVLSEEIPTAATDGKKIYYNPDFMQEADLNERVFVIAHEVGHCMFQHLARFKHYADAESCRGLPWNHQIANAAADYIINDMLVQSSVGTMPKGVLHDTRIATFDDMFEDVYERLYKSEEQRCAREGSSSGDGKGGQIGDGVGDPLDTHMPPGDGQGAEPGSSDPQWQRAVASAANAAKAQGKMPGHLEALVERLLKPKVPWEQALADFLRVCAGQGTKSWRRPNRRKIVFPRVYMPTRSGFEMGEMVIAIDTSASVSEAELQAFLSELAGILNDVRPEVIHFIQCDTRITSTEKLERGTDLTQREIKIAGRGGTYFHPPFDYVAQEGIDPEVFIYFTDMEAEFPNQPDYPVLWVATTDAKAPWGRTVRLEVE